MRGRFEIDTPLGLLVVVLVSIKEGYHGKYALFLLLISIHAF